MSVYRTIGPLVSKSCPRTVLWKIGGTINIIHVYNHSEVVWNWCPPTFLVLVHVILHLIHFFFLKIKATIKYIKLNKKLAHISLVSFLWDTDKQHSPRAASKNEIKNNDYT